MTVGEFELMLRQLINYARVKYHGGIEAKMKH